MLKKFLSDRRGNIATMFALTAIPLLTGIGMTIEYSNLSKHNSELQSAVDAASLFAGKYYMDHNQLPDKALVKKFVESNYDGVINDITFKLENDKIYTKAETRAPSFFFGDIVPDAFDLGAAATVPLGLNSTIEVAMVLDTTRSMEEDGKLDSLKVVATEFIDTMKRLENSSTIVKMGIVPFSNHVNVGMSNRNASWIDVPLDTTFTREVCFNSWPEGVEMTCHQETDYADGIPYQVDVCTPVDTSIVEINTCETKTITRQWYGCVGSRNDPYMTTDGAYATRMPGIIDRKDWHCPSALTPLTDKVTTLKSGIQALVERGDTYIAPGVMWGLRLLSPEAPFTEGSDPAAAAASGTSVRKIMIVMTDGDNSKSPNQPSAPENWGTDLVKANAVTEQACQVARDSNITVYSIVFGTSVSASGQDLMQKCAGDASRYFPAANADALKKAFDSIGSQIVSLRLSS